VQECAMDVDLNRGLQGRKGGKTKGEKETAYRVFMIKSPFAAYGKKEVRWPKSGIFSLFSSNLTKKKKGEEEGICLHGPIEGRDPLAERGGKAPHARGMHPPIRWIRWPRGGKKGRKKGKGGEKRKGNPNGMLACFGTAHREGGKKEGEEGGGGDASPSLFFT